MHHIIATTDFSDVANNAIQYACRLAQDLNASVTLLHSFVIPVTFSDTPMPVIPVDESREIAEERMNTYIRQLQADFPGMEINRKIMYGDIVDCLKEYTEAAPPLLVVMGNSGDDVPGWMGSNLVNALKNLSIPVMGVPAGMSYAPVKNICLASDLKHVTQGGGFPVKQMQRLTEATQAKLHILHINTGNMPKDTGEEMYLRERLVSLQPAYHVQDHTDIEEGIRNFVTENGMDWLIMIPHKYSLLEKLFHKSQTKAVARSSSIPVIALHQG